MTIIFTEDELKYIIKQFGAWKVSDDCPKRLRKIIQEKIDAINQFSKDITKSWRGKNG